MPAAPKKYALLIGNDSYRDERLRPLVVPREDVRGLQSVLKDPCIGAFDEVRELLNADRTGVAGEIERLFAEAERDDLVLLYFSGHGILDRFGRLYLALSETDIDRPIATALRSDDVRDLMEQSCCGRQILILDCCYSGAFARNLKGGDEPPAVTPDTFASQGEGRVALLSSTATQRSFEGNEVLGETERSLFTHYLVHGLQTGEAAPDELQITEEDLFQYAYDRVRAAGAGMTPQRWVGRQHGRLVIARNPHPSAALTSGEGNFPAGLLSDLCSKNHRTRLGAVRELAGLLAQPEVGRLARQTLEKRLALERDSQVRSLIERVLGGRRPEETGEFQALKSAVSGSVRRRLAWIGGLLGGLTLLLAIAWAMGVGVTSKDASLALGGGARGAGSDLRDTLRDGSPGPKMVVLPAGTFVMGSPEDEPEREPDETRRPVEIKRPFAIGRNEVTFAQYDLFATATGRPRPDDAGWGRGQRPVINVSWSDALAYTQWLSEQAGAPYRLPTEAEWEYAARAGTLTPFPTGNCISTSQANYNGKLDYDGCSDRSGVYRGKTLPVGSLAPNPWGLYDTAGNVWEWTLSEYAGHPGLEPASSTGAAAVRRVIRGGSWPDNPGGLRSAGRGRPMPWYKSDDLGFRVVRDL